MPFAFWLWCAWLVLVVVISFWARQQTRKELQQIMAEFKREVDDIRRAAASSGQEEGEE